MSDKESLGGPRKRFLVTPEMIEIVRDLSGKGLTQEQMWGYFGWSQTTWYKATRENPELYEAIFSGKSKMIAHVWQTLLEQSNNGNVAATIFWLKTRAGARETNHLDVSSSDGTMKPELKINTTDPIEASKIYQKIMTGDK